LRIGANFYESISDYLHFFEELQVDLAYHSSSGLISSIDIGKAGNISKPSNVEQMHRSKAWAMIFSGHMVSESGHKARGGDVILRMEKPCCSIDKINQTHSKSINLILAPGWELMFAGYTKFLPSFGGGCEDLFLKPSQKLNPPNINVVVVIVVVVIFVVAAELSLHPHQVRVQQMILHLSQVKLEHVDLQLKKTRRTQ
jgi:hypothetical protein